MIYVIDNGGNYSDRVIYFVEVAPGDHAADSVVTAAASALRRGGHIIMAAETVTWLEGKKLTAKEFVDAVEYCFGYPSSYDKAVFTLAEAWRAAGYGDLPYGLRDRLEDAESRL